MRSWLKTMGCRLTLRGDSDENCAYGSPGKHSAYPRDVITYQGTCYMACFIDVTLTYSILENKINLGPCGMQTNVESFMWELEDCYREGYRLDDVIKMPGMKYMSCWHHLGDQHPYQLVLFKPLNYCTDRSWRLHVEKKMLNFNPVTSHSLNDDDDMLNTVAYHASRGGRLACAKTVGYVNVAPTINRQYSVTGVELFWEIPQHDQPTVYAYHTVCVQAMYTTVYDASGVQRVVCDVDFLTQIQSFLSQGWRLVDICMDVNALTEVFLNSRSSELNHPLNICWIFEKEKRLLDDPTPQYEVHIMEYFHEIERFCGVDKSVSDWRPLIAAMATKGWQLKSVVQLPFVIQTTFVTFTLKLLLVFQRRILPAPRTTTRLTSQWLSAQNVVNSNSHVGNHVSCE